MSAKIVQLIEEIEKIPVLELAELVKSLEDKFDISASMPIAPAASVSSADAVPAEEKSEFKVTLKDFGAQKIKVIKAIRSITILTLKEARDLVEAAPAVISESVPKQEAQKIKASLEEAGATVELS